ncbi:MAG: TonB C-terminal domain-containing protein [Elusimicrobia bacterium]|nr:TonB C-terminal domain-containing protein [Elusimicrobiota bacterium]
MITPGMSLKKALLLSLVFHIIFIITTFPRFHRKPVQYWMATPVELVSLPAADTAVTQLVKPAAPAQEKKEPIKEKKAIEKKAKAKKDVVAINPKKKKYEEKPQPLLKEIPPPAPAAPPAAIPAPIAPVPVQSTVIRPDVNDFPFLYYLNIIQKNVSANWNFAYEGTVHQKVVVFFKIDKNGKIYDSEVEKSSGIAFLDQSALRAVLLASPFPPLPNEYDGAFLGIHFGFEFKNEG